MAAKKISKDVDLAAGFFSQPSAKEKPGAEIVQEKITAPKTTEKEKPPKKKEVSSKNVGGRPKKDGLKNEQFTLTMNPETYEKLRVVANEHTRGNFSGLIDEAVKAFCREKNIDLSKIEVKPQVLELYREKQEKRARKTKK